MNNGICFVVAGFMWQVGFAMFAGKVMSVLALNW